MHIIDTEFLIRVFLVFHLLIGEPDASKSVCRAAANIMNLFTQNISEISVSYKNSVKASERPKISCSRDASQIIRNYMEDGNLQMEHREYFFVLLSMYHKGQEPPHHDKYLLWGNILKENNPKFPRVRFNGNKCKFLLTSLNNTQVIEKDNKFKKDKRSEDVSSGVLPEEATHFGDAADKKIWIKYGSRLQRFSSFIPARI